MDKEDSTDVASVSLSRRVPDARRSLLTLKVASAKPVSPLFHPVIATANFRSVLVWSLQLALPTARVRLSAGTVNENHFENLFGNLLY